MRIFLDCVQCFVKQTLDACRMVTPDEAVHERVLRTVLARAAGLSFDRSPPHMGREIHRIIREQTGDTDPYMEMKTRFNRLGMELLPRLRKRVVASPDPFETAVRLAIAGNIIDPGLTSRLNDDSVRETIEDSLRRHFAVNDLERLRVAVEGARRILYLGDNAGEIVLDRLLIEEIPFERATFAVRGKPVINDVTMQDAEDTGMTEIVRVIDNGSDAPGTILETCSRDFLRAFERSDVIIAKGQGNYETLSEIDQPIFFLLKAKCPVIARDIGCEVGSIVAKASGVR
jgi:uncharacterized protein with ATP-grasp and redox domains